VNSSSCTGWFSVVVWPSRWLLTFVRQPSIRHGSGSFCRFSLLWNSSIVEYSRRRSVISPRSIEPAAHIWKCSRSSHSRLLGLFCVCPPLRWRWCPLSSAIKADKTRRRRKGHNHDRSLGCCGVVSSIRVLIAFNWTWNNSLCRCTCCCNYIFIGRIYKQTRRQTEESELSVLFWRPH
jgi:hypothetical protein